jgi:general secretion pathway protein M
VVAIFGRRIGSTPAASAFGQRLAAWRERWDRLAARERQLTLAAVAVVAVFVVVTLGIRPAWRILKEAPPQLDALDNELQTMQRLAGEVRELRTTPTIGMAQSALALKAATDRIGERARLTVQGDRAVLTLDGVSGTALRSWLLEVRTGARARAIGAQLTRGPQGFTGTVTVALGGTP